MPVYEYHCADCQHRFETLLRSMTGPRKVACPQCRGTRVQRLLSVFSTAQSSGPGVPETGAGPCGRCGDPAGSCGREG